MQTMTLTHGGPEGASYRIDVPTLGLGVFQATPGQSTKEAVLDALEVGYRHIDTAALYRNEADVGAAVRESGIPREQIHITTKLWRDVGGYQAALDAFGRSRDDLGLDVVDLYLVHAPPPEPARREVWRAMEELLSSGAVRAIGVSNYGIAHLQSLFEHARVFPCNNQLELTPYLQRRDLAQFCRERDIALTAYSPLTKGHKLRDPALMRIAEKLGKSPAQVLIRWGLEQGFIVIPKSVHVARIRENFEVSDWRIPTDELSTMGQWEEDLVTGWDPTVQP